VWFLRWRGQAKGRTTEDGDDDEEDGDDDDVRPMGQSTYANELIAMERQASATSSSSGGRVCVCVVVATFVTFRFFAEFVFFLFLFFSVRVYLFGDDFVATSATSAPASAKTDGEKKQTNKKRTQK